MNEKNNPRELMRSPWFYEPNRNSSRETSSTGFFEVVL